MTDLASEKSLLRQEGDVEARILQLARDEPELGQAAVAVRLSNQGYPISASGVRYIWQKHGLETTVKRLRALADQADRGIEALTEKQRRLLARGDLSASLARNNVPSTATGNDDEPLERRRIILNVAAELFSEYGYDRTSIRDIARRVGLLPGSVYHHFPSKEDLYLEIHREGFRRVMERVKAAAAGGKDPWDSLRLACEVHVAGMVEGSPIDRITGHNLALTGHQDLFEKVKSDRDAYEQLFKSLMDALPLRPGSDRSLLRLTLLGAMNWVAIWYREGRRTPVAIADAMVEMMRRGVGD